MDLNKVLESFARGEINKEKAREMIHAAYSKMSAKAHELREEGEKGADASESAGDSFRKAFDKIKKTKNIDDFLKVSSGLVHQIAEKVPGEIEKIQENVLSDMNIAGFSANIKGVTSKFSIFRGFEVDKNCDVEENLAVGSQWFAVRFSNRAEVLKNKFTAVQLSEVDVGKSSFLSNNVALSRISNVTLAQSRIDANRISRATLSDVSMTDSDFKNGALVKSEFAQTVINGTRFAKCQFVESTLRECDFDDCNLQGVVFENCRLEECSFSDVQVTCDTVRTISEQVVVGRAVSGVRTFEELVAALCEGSSTADLPHAAHQDQKSVRAKKSESAAQPAQSVPRKRVAPERSENASRKPSVAQKQRVSETSRRKSSPKKHSR